jgi:predicted phage terminase large subunit-like protein
MGGLEPKTFFFSDQQHGNQILRSATILDRPLAKVRAFEAMLRRGLAAEHRATTVLIENAGPGMNLLQDLRAAMPQGMTRPIGVKPEGSKVDRMAAQSAKIEAGHVHLPNSAPWLGDFLTELLSFPNGRHDDQVDSVSQFLRWLQSDAYSQIPIVAPILITRADMGLPPLHIDWSCRH